MRPLQRANADRQPDAFAKVFCGDFADNLIDNFVARNKAIEAFALTRLEILWQKTLWAVLEAQKEVT